jgi:hypothetical protein
MAGGARHGVGGKARMVRLGLVWQAWWARRGMASRVGAWQAWRGQGWPGTVRLVRLGTVRQARQGQARRGKRGVARRVTAGLAWQGMAGTGRAWLGTAWQAGLGRDWQGRVRRGPVRPGRHRMVNRARSGWQGRARQARKGMVWSGSEGRGRRGAARDGGLGGFRHRSVRPGRPGWAWRAGLGEARRGMAGEAWYVAASCGMTWRGRRGAMRPGEDGLVGEARQAR